MAITVAALQTKMGYDDDEFTRGLDRSQSKLSSFGAIAKTGLLAAGTAIAAGLTAVAASVTTVEDAFTPLMTMTGKNTEQFKLMAEGAKEVIRSSPHSAADIGMAAYEILGAGITDAAEAQKTLVAANKLSLAGLGTIGESVDLITSAMNAWRSENISGEQAAGVLFGTLSVGKGTVADFSRGFGAIAPTASAVGVSFKELMAATATLTTSGLPAAEAYTQLREVFNGIVKPTEGAAKLAKSLGIEMDYASIKSKGLQGFLEHLMVQTGGNTDTLFKLFGSMQAVNAVIGLTGPNAEAFAGSFEKIDQAAGNLDETAKNVSETFSNRIKIMKNNVLLYLSDIGNKGLDWLSDKWKAWGPSITGAINDFRSELDGIGSPDSGFFAKLGDAAGKGKIALGEIFTDIKSGFDRFIDGWNSPGRGPSDFWAELGGHAKDAKDDLNGVFEEIKTAFGKFIDGWESPGRGPGDFWAELGGKAKDASENIRGATRDFLDFIKQLNENSQKDKDTNSGLYKFSVQVDAAGLWIAKTAVDALIGAFNVLNWISVNVVIPALEGLKWLLETVGRITIAAVVPAFNFLIGQLDSIGRFVLKIAFPWLADQLDLIGRITMAIVAPAFRWLIDQLDQIGRFTMGIVVPAFRWLLDQLDQIGRGAMTAMQGIGRAIQWLRPFLSISLWDVGSWLWNAGVNLIQGFIGGINSMWNAAANAARNLVSNAVNSAWKALTPGSPSRKGRAIGRNFTEGIIQGMQDNEGLISSVAANMANAMVSASQYNYNIGGPGNVQVNMPQGSNGNDVVRALRDWQKINGRIPVAVTGRNA